MNFSKLYFALSIIILIVAVSPVQSATIHVPADQPTIQAGIDAASDGDTVIVAPGTYTGHGNRDIDYSGKAILVTSTGGPKVTIIDCQGSAIEPHRGFLFRNFEDTTSRLRGFTVINGYAPNDFMRERGGALGIQSSPLIEDCAFSNNYADEGGSAVWIQFSSGVVFRSCLFESNLNRHAISCVSGSMRLDSCQFKQNLSGAVSAHSGSRVELYQCVFTDNQSSQGACVRIFGATSLTAEHCRFRSNLTTPGGEGAGIWGSDIAVILISECVFERHYGEGSGGAAVWFGYGSSADINNTTFYGNGTSGNGGVIYTAIGGQLTLSNSIVAYGSMGGSVFVDTTDDFVWGPGSADFLCCDIYGNIGGDWTGAISGQNGSFDNFSIDPLFCDTTAGDFHIDKFSLCAATYNSCGVLIGALDVGCDFGFICADANGDSLVNVDDVDFLIDFYFYGGATPSPHIASDLNCDGSVNIADITYLAAYINGTGAAPCCAE